MLTRIVMVIIPLFHIKSLHCTSDLTYCCMSVIIKLKKKMGIDNLLQALHINKLQGDYRFNCDKNKLSTL